MQEKTERKTLSKLSEPRANIPALTEYPVRVNRLAIIYFLILLFMEFLIAFTCKSSFKFIFRHLIR